MSFFTDNNTLSGIFNNMSSIYYSIYNTKCKDNLMNMLEKIKKENVRVFEESDIVLYEKDDGKFIPQNNFEKRIDTGIHIESSNHVVEYQNKISIHNYKVTKELKRADMLKVIGVLIRDNDNNASNICLTKFTFKFGGKIINDLNIGIIDKIYNCVERNGNHIYVNLEKANLATTINNLSAINSTIEITLTFDLFFHKPQAKEFDVDIITKNSLFYDDYRLYLCSKQNGLGAIHYKNTGTRLNIEHMEPVRYAIINDFITSRLCAIKANATQPNNVLLKLPRYMRINGVFVHGIPYDKLREILVYDANNKHSKSPFIELKNKSHIDIFCKKIEHSHSHPNECDVFYIPLSSNEMNTGININSCPLTDIMFKFVIDSNEHYDISMSVFIEKPMLYCIGLLHYPTGDCDYNDRDIILSCDDTLEGDNKT